MMNKVVYIILISTVVAIGVSAQSSVSYEELSSDVGDSHAAVEMNSDSIFAQATKVDGPTTDQDKIEAELIETIEKCSYYKAHIDLESLKNEANQLFAKAKEYKQPNYQAIAKYYLFEVSLFTELYDKALKEINDGMKYVERAEREGSLSRGTKINYYIGYSNYYLKINDPENQMKYIRKSGEEILKLPEGDGKYSFLHLYYSNLAQVFRERKNLDSAQFYAELSNSLEEKYKNHNTKLMNYQIIGELAKSKKDYNQALKWFLLAEEQGNQEAVIHLNLIDLYNHIIECYTNLDDSGMVEVYRIKKATLELKVSKSQNKVLNELLHKIDNKIGVRNRVLALYIFISTLVFGSILLGWKKRVAFLGKKEEEISIKTVEEHHKLIEMVKANDYLFMSAFLEVYPDFQDKLLNIAPDMTEGDIEFCALLKLQIPSKKIAEYTFIAPKTVLNKRYLIRKKLNLDKDTDLYKWFEEV